MKHITNVLLAAVALTVLASCGGGAPASSAGLSIVPNPVSLEYAGRGVALPSDGTAPKVTTRIDPKLAPEEYVLDTRKGKVLIAGGSQAGIFWGEQTLTQILAQCDTHIPGVLIQDKPAFAYRGAHLDCCRHFFSIDEVKQYIDILAE
ncbi:MAG: family 20 glycosylhydrolase, partial [Bacteroidales bacterium]|nr:family 20 glycosylhydrolase [Bacteroidales bacterium]